MSLKLAMKHAFRSSRYGWLLWVLAACTNDSTRATASAGTGLKVPLPPGWTAKPSGTSRLEAGPPGQPTLVRIERRTLPGVLPTASDLRDSLAKSLPDFRASLELGSSETTRVAALVRFDERVDAGVTVIPRYAVLGIARTSQGEFSCSTTVLGEADARVAYGVCADLTFEAP